MSQLLKNKTALITGGSRGIGESIVKKFAEHGSNIAFTYLSSEEKANALVAELEKMGVKAKAYKTDASDFKATEEMVNDVVKEFGTIDICVNNAGISKDNLLLR